MWSYDDISIFVTVIEQGSFTGASRKLDIPCSTVSRRVEKLESSLKIKLIERTSRKLTITHQGKVFYEQCAPLLRNLEVKTAQLTASRDELGGKLKIVAPSFLGRELLGSWVIDFLMSHDNIKLELLLDDKNTDLVGEQIDIAIRVGPLESSSFVAQRLWTSVTALCASNDYLERHEDIVTPADIKNHDAIFFRKAVEKWEFRHITTFETFQIKPNCKIYVNDIKIVAHAVSMGLGIACLPLLSVSSLVQSCNVTRLLPDYNIEPTRSLYAVYPDSKYLSKSAQVFLAYIKDKFQVLNGTSS